MDTLDGAGAGKALRQHLGDYAAVRFKVESARGGSLETHRSKRSELLPTRRLTSQLYSARSRTRQSLDADFYRFEEAVDLGWLLAEFGRRTTLKGCSPFVIGGIPSEPWWHNRT